MGVGIDHDGAQFLVTQKALNGGGAAAYIEQARGADPQW